MPQVLKGDRRKMLETGVGYFVGSEPLWLSIEATTYRIELEIVLGSPNLSPTQISWGPAETGEHLLVQIGTALEETGGGTVAPIRVTRNSPVVYFEFAIVKASSDAPPWLLYAFYENDQ